MVTELVKEYPFRDHQEICCHGISVSPDDALAALNESKKLTKGNWPSRCTGLSLDAIDLFEINEAFAVVELAAIRPLKLDPQKGNVNGGAVAFGPLTLCIGGGEAVAMVVERAS